MIERPGNSTGSEKANARTLEIKSRLETEDMQYLALRDIRRRLIPTMREQDIARVLLYAYRGEEPDPEGLLTILREREEGHREHIVIQDGETSEDIALFSPPSDRSGFRKRTAHTKKSITEWLHEKGLQSHTATFCPFLEEDNETSHEQPEETQEPPTAQKAKKHKKIRRMKRRKPTRAARKEQRSAALAENDRNALYDAQTRSKKLLKRMRNAAMHSADTTIDLKSETSAIVSALVDVFDTTPTETAKLREAIKAEEYESLRHVLLRFYAVGETREKFISDLRKGAYTRKTTHRGDARVSPRKNKPPPSCEVFKVS